VSEGATLTEPERARRLLSAGVRVFRWVAFAWMTVLNLTASEPLRRPVLAWVAIAATGLWIAYLTATRTEHLPGVLWADLGISVALVIVAGLVTEPGSDRLFFATAYPAATALAWGAERGVRGGVFAALCLSAALVVERAIEGPLSDLGAKGTLSLVNGIVYYLLAGAAAGTVSKVLDRSEEQLRVAQENAMRARERAARLAEREALGRAIHDSVLQSLALVHKRGRELGEHDTTVPAVEVLRLAEIAGEQEQALRALILREPEDPPTGMASLRGAVEDEAKRTDGVPVTVSAVGAVWVPAGAAAELAAAVRQALDNVVEHAEASRAAVFVDAEDGWLVISVRDNGRGFVYDEAQLKAAGKAGLMMSMRGRVEGLGGRMRVDTAPGIGTEVEFRVPLPDGGGT
jgi:signal transduction histidine kinase